MKKVPTSVRLYEETKQLISSLADTLGVSQTAVVELAIREKAREVGSKDMKHKMAFIHEDADGRTLELVYWDDRIHVSILGRSRRMEISLAPEKWDQLLDRFNAFRLQQGIPRTSY